MPSWLLVAAATASGSPLADYLTAATANVILPCMTAEHELAVTPELAAAPPECSWIDYRKFVIGAGLGWTDDPATASLRTATDVQGGITVISTSEVELTSSISTALTIVDVLRRTLGDAAYAARTEPVVVDMVGWAFHWTVREEVDGTSNTVEVATWDAGLQRATRLFWGAQIGGALRRMLPLVESVTIRGYGPEAPAVARTTLREDNWLHLELYTGIYDRLSEPAPSLTLLENSGMHDDLWPSDGGCISDKGAFEGLTAAELARRKASGDTQGVGSVALMEPPMNRLVSPLTSLLTSPLLRPSDETLRRTLWQDAPTSPLTTPLMCPLTTPLTSSLARFAYQAWLLVA